MVQMTEAINVCKGGAEALNFDAMKFDVEVGPLKDRDDNEISSTIELIVVPLDVTVVLLIVKV